jgi:hypothetical protein
MEAQSRILKIATYEGLYDIQGTLSRHNTVSCLLWFDQNLRLFSLMFFCLEYPVFVRLHFPYLVRQHVSYPWRWSMLH